MKIAFAGLELPEGKFKYEDRVFLDMVEKFKPLKQTSYFFEFLPQGYAPAAAIAVAEESILDLLILDMEKLEGRLLRAETDLEKNVLSRCLRHIEEQKPICDMTFEAAELSVIKTIGPLSLKPTAVIRDASAGPAEVARAVLEKASMMFFYTVGKEEVHSWLVGRNTDAVTCAGRIHSDLARGFVKAEIVAYSDMMKVRSMQEARSRGFTRLVDRDFPIPDETILEIRFNI